MKILKSFKKSINKKLLLIVTFFFFLLSIVSILINNYTLKFNNSMALNEIYNSLGVFVEDLVHSNIDNISSNVDYKTTIISHEFEILGHLVQDAYDEEVLNEPDINKNWEDDVELKSELIDGVDYKIGDSSVFIPFDEFEGENIKKEVNDSINKTSFINDIIPYFISGDLNKGKILFISANDKKFVRMYPYKESSCLCKEKINSRYVIDENMKYYLEKEAKEGTEISDLMVINEPFTKFDGKKYIRYNYPIFGVDKELVGIVAYDLEVEDFNNLLKEKNIIDNTYVIIVNSDKRIIAMNEEKIKILGIKPKKEISILGFNNEYLTLEDSIFDSIQTLSMNISERAVTKKVVLSGKKYILTQRKIFNYRCMSDDGIKYKPLNIFSIVPENEMFSIYYKTENNLEKDVNDLILLILASTILIASMFVVILHRIMKLVTKDLVSLSEKVKKVNLNDFDVDIEVRSEDEIGNLSFAIKKMVFEIKNAFDSLEKKNNQLSLEIEERERQNKIIEYLENFDNQSNLPNKKALLNILSSSEIKNEEVTLIIIGIDEFRRINEVYGWNYGDELILAISKRIKSNIKKKGSLFKLTGDEFAILLEDENSDTILHMVEAIINDFREPFDVDMTKILVSCSVGVSSYPMDTNNVEDLLKLSTNAMAHTKEHNKGRYEFYNNSINEKAIRRMEILNKISYALKNDEFELYYQPVVNTMSKRIVSFEALIRWHNKELGNVSPGVFIPIIERTDYIISVGEWVMKRAFEDLAKIHNLGYRELSVAVNVSVNQFVSTNFISRVKEIAYETKVDTTKVNMEVTERLFISDIDFVISVLNKLRTLGINISIDDFGTGYSSLSLIKDLPISKIKIDKSFIDEIETLTNKKLISAIIGLSRNLNIETVAEGVEYDNQYEFIKGQRCDEIQGYYFSKPVPFDELVDYIKDNLGEL